MSRKDYVCCIILLAVVEMIGEYSTREKLTEVRTALKEALKESQNESKD